MSRNAENDNNRQQLKLDRLNWPTWSAKTKDYILALDHDDATEIWTAYEWKRTAANQDDIDPAEFDYQEGAGAAMIKLRDQHNMAFRYIMETLDAELYDTTLQLPFSVPKLLRHLHRQVVSDETVSDRDSMQTQYQSLSLDNCSDKSALVTQFRSLISSKRGLRLASLLHKGLRGPRGSTPIIIIIAQLRYGFTFGESLCRLPKTG
jgi:hypothetical protein